MPPPVVVPTRYKTFGPAFCLFRPPTTPCPLLLEGAGAGEPACASPPAPPPRPPPRPRPPAGLFGRMHGLFGEFEFPPGFKITCKD